MRAQSDNEDFDGAIHVRGSRRKFYEEEKPASSENLGPCLSVSPVIAPTTKPKFRRNSIDSFDKKVVRSVQGVQTFLAQQRSLEAEFFVTDVPEIEVSFERLGIAWKPSRTTSASSGSWGFSRTPSAFSTASVAEAKCSENKE